MIQLCIKSIIEDRDNPENFEFPENLFSLKCADRSIQMVYSVDIAIKKRSFAHTKDRGEVSGTTKKMYRQKGTGGARHGSARVSQFRGGGVTFGPKFSERSIRVNKKLRSLVALTCLNKHISRGSLFVLDHLNSKEPKTKTLISQLDEFFKKNLNDNTSKNLKDFFKRTGCLFVDSIDSKKNDSNFALSSRNLIGIKYVADGSISIVDLLSHGVICITRDALSKTITHFYEKLYLIK